MVMIDEKYLPAQPVRVEEVDEIDRMSVDNFEEVEEIDEHDIPPANTFTNMIKHVNPFKGSKKGVGRGLPPQHSAHKPQSYMPQSYMPQPFVPHHQHNHNTGMFHFGKKFVPKTHDEEMKEKIGDKSVIKKVSINTYKEVNEKGVTVHKCAKSEVYGCICRNWMGKKECLNPYAGEDSCGCYDAYKYCN